MSNKEEKSTSIEIVRTYSYARASLRTIDQKHPKNARLVGLEIGERDVIETEKSIEIKLIRFYSYTRTCLRTKD